jgi:hypothetical protein
MELLKTHLPDRQVLLFTHDRFWRDLLHRHLNTWHRINFTGYSFGVGPTMKPAKGALKRIQEQLTNDEPDDAGKTLGSYLEDVVQELCECFEAEVKYTKRGDYTLDTLLDRLRMRLETKLSKDHDLTKKIDYLFKDNAYRNWCTHCKNPESPIDVSEIQSLLDQWIAIEKLVRCSETTCFEFLKADCHGFVCSCGKTRLAKSSSVPVTAPAAATRPSTPATTPPAVSM